MHLDFSPTSRRPRAHLDARPPRGQATREEQILWDIWTRLHLRAHERWALANQVQPSLPVGTPVRCLTGHNEHFDGVIIRIVARTAQYMVFQGTREEVEAQLAKGGVILGPQVPYEDVSPI